MQYILVQSLLKFLSFQKVSQTFLKFSKTLLNYLNISKFSEKPLVYSVQYTLVYTVLVKHWVEYILKP